LLGDEAHENEMMDHACHGLFGSLLSWAASYLDSQASATQVVAMQAMLVWLPFSADPECNGKLFGCLDLRSYPHRCSLSRTRAWLTRARLLENGFGRQAPAVEGQAQERVQEPKP
jgi:hypothetical protein